MYNQPKNNTIIWRDGTVPIASAYDDPYFSLHDGLEESRHVFLAGNDLPQRFQDGFQIGELGFGTGLNVLAAWHAWHVAGSSGVLHITSFERSPLTIKEMARALERWDELAELSQTLLQGLTKNPEYLHTDSLELKIHYGDARKTLPAWQGSADAWFLDGFNPAKNISMWGSALLQSVAQHTNPSGTFATYTAAGAVRRALTDAGFDVTRQKGYAQKRHMSVGKLSAK